MLAVLTGPVRSGKSRMALELAQATNRPVVLAVAGIPDDPEMVRRIERHRAGRSAAIAVVEIGDSEDWLVALPEDACVVLDCLGTLVARLMGTTGHDDAILVDAEIESSLEASIDSLVDRLTTRTGDTIVVTNEVGWGVVPTSPTGRLFRDALGRAHVRLVTQADCAWLVVAGRAVDLTALPREVTWPSI